MMTFGNLFLGKQNLLLEVAGIGLLFFVFIFLVTSHVLRIKKIFASFISIGIVLMIGFGLYTYYLSSAPKIIRITPGENETGAALNRKIEIFFDRPISRPRLSVTLTPEVAGRWVYDDPVIPKHMMRRLTFVPNETLPPDTEFEVKLTGIGNVRRTSTAYDYSFKFKTQESPKIARIEPGNNEKNVHPDTKIEVFLTAPNGVLSQINFEMIPRIAFEVKEDVTRTHLTLTPKEPLVQGTNYQLRITKADLQRNLATNEVVRTGIEKLIFTDSFSVKEAAGIDSFMPTGNKVSSKQPITIRFSKPMVEEEVRRNFSISPAIEGSSLLIDGVIFVFTPKKYDFKTTYKVRLASGTHALDGSFLSEDLIHAFTTLGSVVVEKFMPRNDTLGADVNSPIKVFFDQDVVADSAKVKLSITPKTEGELSLEGKTLVFTPNKPLRYGTKYTVFVEKGVASVEGLESETDFSASFSTEPESVILSVPVLLQQHALSCEAAALRMALAYRKVSVGEDVLLGQIGIDPTNHRGNIWGNPYEAFVGNVDGKQMSTGYGVYWGPIVRVASNYRRASEFSGWPTTRVFAEIKKGNPVILWTHSASEPSYWSTPRGEKIFAAAGEHAVVIVGFVGSADSPEQVIVNDPLEGRVYWSRGTFEKKFAAFVGSGVVVY